MHKIFTVLFFVCNLFAKAQQIPEKPNPILYVNDYASVLSPDIKNELENNLKAFAEKTSKIFVIATVNTSGSEDIATFSLNWAEKWGIGKKSQNNGIFFLVAVQDHRMRIEVGYGNESELTDAESSIILNSIKPDFRANNYNAGITKAAYQIIRQLDSSFVVNASLSNHKSIDRNLRTYLLPSKPLYFEKIVDLDDLLNENEESEVNKLIKSYHNKSIRLKTILVKNSSKYSTKVGSTAYIDFAYDISRYWDLVPYNDYKSVLLLIQTDYNYGYGQIQAHGSDDAMGNQSIYDSLVTFGSELSAHIKQNEFKKGIEHAINRVGGLIAKNKQSSDWEQYTYIFFFILGFVIFISLVIFLSNSKSGSSSSSYGYGGSSNNNYSGYRNSYSDSYSDSSYSDSSSSYSDYGGGSFGGGGASGDW